jgi:hypothetical protein
MLTLALGFPFPHGLRKARRSMRQEDGQSNEQQQLN